jgi:hypothetical protein
MLVFSSISFFFFPDENNLLKKPFLAGVESNFANFHFCGSIVSTNISAFGFQVGGGVANIDALTLIALSSVSPKILLYFLNIL